MSCYVQSRNGKQFEVSVERCLRWPNKAQVYVQIECLRSEDDVTENLMFKVHLDGF